MRSKTVSETEIIRQTKNKIWMKVKTQYSENQEVNPGSWLNVNYDEFEAIAINNSVEFIIRTQYTGKSRSESTNSLSPVPDLSAKYESSLLTNFCDVALILCSLATPFPQVRI